MRRIIALLGVITALMPVTAHAALPSSYEGAAERYWHRQVEIVNAVGDEATCTGDTMAYVITVLDDVVEPLPWTIYRCLPDWRTLTGEQQCWGVVHESGHMLNHGHARRGVMAPRVPNNVKLKVCQRYGPKE